MTLIPCDENCIYQTDGYCQLETISLVTDCTQNGCVHKISSDSKNDNKQNNPVILQEQKSHL